MVNRIKRKSAIWQAQKQTNTGDNCVYALAVDLSHFKE